MIAGFTVLLVFQLIGEVVGYFLGQIVPGPVIGMALAALALTLTRRRPALKSLGEKTIASSTAILANLGVLFVPAGVGIIQHLDLVRERGVALSVTIIVSTVATLVVTVWVFLAAKRFARRIGDG